MGLTVDSRIKTPDDGILVLHMKIEARAVEHNSLAK